MKSKRTESVRRGQFMTLESLRELGSGINTHVPNNLKLNNWK